MEYRLDRGVALIQSEVILRVKSAYSDIVIDRKFKNGSFVAAVVFTEEYVISSITAKDSRVILYVVPKSQQT